jgi:hypothetical protein
MKHAIKPRAAPIYIDAQPKKTEKKTLFFWKPTQAADHSRTDLQ